jgi:DNA adenine methylase
MTAYHGGKQRIGREIATIIHEVSTMMERDYGFKIKGYCEPFCGMLGVYQHIPELFASHRPKLQYKAGDTNESVIKMWKEAQKGWIPPSSTLLTKKNYDKLKNSTKASADKGFVGHMCTFRGIYFGGYFNHKKSKIKTNSDNVIRISNIIKNVKLSSCVYTRFSDLRGYVIYCDPPYNNSEQRYYNESSKKREFNNFEFWNWCREISRYNLVFVSEYNAPSDFVRLWSKTSLITGIGKGSCKRIESLFLPP